MRYTCLYFLLLSSVMLLFVPVAAQPNASWEGLVGLYTQPTAEILKPGEVAITYSELRFQQEKGLRRSNNVWYTANVTAALTKQLEVGVTLRNEDFQYFQGVDLQPSIVIQNDKFIGDMKYVITPPKGRKVGIAVGVKDITNTTNNLDGFITDRGRRFFAVGSYQWAHLGVTHDNNGFGAFAGADFNVSDNVNLIAELVTKTTFTGVPAASNKTNFNLGLRITPRNTPRMRIDFATIGDGKFDYGFSFSYRL